MHDLFHAGIVVQIVAVLTVTTLFLVLLEGFGFAATALSSLATRRLDKVREPQPTILVRIFIGGLAYVLCFFVLGLANVLITRVVMGVSIVVPMAVFVAAKRWRGWRLRLPISYAPDSLFSLLGGLIFLSLTFIFWFRPITNFDGLWYHLEVPKLFLQHHTIADQGYSIRYSLQPSLDYFLNLWPLSLPVPTVAAGLVINSIQACLLAISLVFVTQVSGRIWSLSRFQRLIAPTIVGSTYITLGLLGGGGNDLLGIAYGLTAVFYSLELLNRPKITWQQFVVAVLLIVGLATVKLFFTMFAVLVLLYLVCGAWNKLPRTASQRQQAMRLLIVLTIIFALTYLPWVVRSLIESGKLLDPIGESGLTNLTYLNEGGGTAQNHWTLFVFQRFYNAIWPVLLFMYTPLVLAGVLSIHNPVVKKKAANLWIISVVGFLVIFFASIALQWRYYVLPLTILTLLGLIAIRYALEQIDSFGRCVVWGAVIVITLLGFWRTIYATPDNAGYPSINQKVYVLHYGGTNNYLNSKLGALYDYVQQSSPRDLRPNETVLLANIYTKMPNVWNVHNFAYIKNPIIEPTINSDDFARVKDVADLKALLHEDQVRYVVTRNNLGQFCASLGIKDYAACNDTTMFQRAYHDPAWNITWYKLR